MAEQRLETDGVEVFVEGEGPRTLVMIHGWPDTYRLWDAQVAALRADWRCVRFTLPGYDVARPPRPTSLEQMLALFEAIVDQVSPGQPVTLMLHDWGCIFGYQYILRHPERVERIIGVDIGDTSSRAYLKSLTAKAILMIMGYQLWLALAWKVGGVAPGMGNRMTRWMARMLRCRAEPALIGWQMNYPYYILWTGRYGSYRGFKPFEPHCPMLYLYGRRKPFLFHAPGWLERLRARPGSSVIEFNTGHWLMVEQADAFNRAVVQWLATGTA